MDRLTAQRVNGIKSGYWSPAKKDELVQRLGKYEDTGMEPEGLRKAGKWIPVEERLPDNAKYILLSFTNFPVPSIGRYEKDTEGGAFYLGDCDEDDTCISMNLFVNAWMPLPEPYCLEVKTPERKQEWKERMLQNFMKKGAM